MGSLRVSPDGDSDLSGGRVLSMAITVPAVVATPLKRKLSHFSPCPSLCFHLRTFQLQMTGQGRTYPRAAKPGPDFHCYSVRRVEVAWSDLMPELRDEERPRQLAVETED